MYVLDARSRKNSKRSSRPEIKTHNVRDAPCTVLTLCANPLRTDAQTTQAGHAEEQEAEEEDPQPVLQAVERLCHRSTTNVKRHSHQHRCRASQTYKRQVMKHKAGQERHHEGSDVVEGKQVRVPDHVREGANGQLPEATQEPSAVTPILAQHRLAIS